MWLEPKLDNYQFDRRPNVVSADTEISFQDFKTMHVERRKVQQDRRLETPQWALNDEMVRAIILHFGEDRCYIRNHNGTDEERMARVRAAAEGQLATKKARLEEMMKQYAAYTSEERADKEHQKILRKFAAQIQVLDTDILMLQGARFMAVATAIVYRYYRQGHDSVSIAEEFGVKSPMVRMWLYRMNTVACKLGFPCSVARLRNNSQRTTARVRAGRYSTIRLWDKKKVMALFALRTGGASVSLCARVLGVQVYAVTLAWRYYFGNLRVARPYRGTRRRVGKPIPSPRAGLSPFRVRMAERLRQLFVLRTSGKTWKVCGRALGIRGTSALLLWKRHYGELNARRHEKPRPPKDRKRHRRSWAPERLAQLRQLRESGKTFRAIAEVMGLKRGQHAYSMWAAHCKG